MGELNTGEGVETDRSRQIAVWFFTIWAIEALAGFAIGFTYPWLVWLHLIADVFGILPKFVTG
jgi:hypothetical protein